MAVDDILLKRSETVSPYSDNMLNPYKEFEIYVGMRQEFSSSAGFPSIFYDEYIKSTDLASNCQQWNGYDYSDEGVEVLNYDLGSGSSPLTPMRYKLIPSRDYLKNKMLYYITIKSEGVFFTTKNSTGEDINYKFQLYWGWNKGYYKNGTSVNNPIFGTVTLDTIKTALSGYDPTKLAKSFSFAELYVRATKNGMTVTGSGGTSLNSNVFWGFTRYYALNGVTKTLRNGPYAGDGGFTLSNTNFDGQNNSNFFIPGNYHDTSDPDKYFIYGICATNKKLDEDNVGSVNAYIDLSSDSTNVQLFLQYIGDDNDFYNSSGQSTNSKSGFLNFSSGSQDRIDNLRYIYICRVPFDTGFTIAYNNNNYLIVRGLKNIWHKIRIEVHFDITPYGWGYLRSDTLKVKLSYKGNSIIIDLMAKMISEISDGSVYIIIDDVDLVKGGNSTEGTYWSASASPSSINWAADYSSNLTINYVQLDGTNQSVSPTSLTMDPTSYHNYCCAKLYFEYGRESSTSSEVKFKMTNFFKSMED